VAAARAVVSADPAAEVHVYGAEPYPYYRRPLLWEFIAGKDADVGQVYVCSVCDWTGEGEPPDQCPLCKAKREKFVTF
jgi:hypothetical protein